MKQFYEGTDGKTKQISSQKQRQMYENQIQYFEIELKAIGENKDSNFLIIVRDLTSVIRSQQKLSDKMYQDAIESNYSHEQMTPLNCILANSKIVLKRFRENFELLEEYYKVIQDPEGAKKMKIRGDETLKILRAIEQSGQAMWFYNQNQIQRMKIRKDEFISKSTFARSPDQHIQKVVHPFEPQINSREIKIYFARKRELKF